MKIFCVTGAPGSDLTLVENILAQAGVDKSRPSRLDPALDIARWHEQVLASVDGPERAVQQPGRLWEQLAGSIFLENIDTPLWGWADARSTWLLDFWRDFEPGVQFVLVHTSPQRALGLASSRDANYDPAAVLDAWHVYHQQLLRFHLRHPRRSLLVDAAECEAAPQQLVAACASHWGLSFPARPAPARAPAAGAPLAHYLAHQFCQTRPDVLALQHEASASLHSLAAPAPGGTGLLDAMRDFAQLHERAGGVPALRHELGQAHDLIEQLRKDNDAADAARKSEQAQAAEVKRKLDWTEQQRRELNQELQAYQAAVRERDQMRAELQAVQTALNDGQKENELLLLQLHQVQEELEHYFLEYQTAHLKHGEVEARWERMLARHPDYCDYHAINAHIEQLAQDSATIYWQVTKLAAAGRILPELRFRTVVARDALHFVFDLADCEADAGLRRWPAPGARQVHLAAHGGAASHLAGADLRLLQSLCQLLGNAVDRKLVRLDGVAGPAFVELLRRHANALQALPATLRYDQVRLEREQVNPDYEHLWLVLDNVEIDELHVPRFEFRLSCAAVQPQRFGSHPKLEFPATTAQAPLERWFAEAADDFGDKLELRFALPDAMDVSVWQVLSPRDHAFLAALIVLLPHLLDTLEHRETGISRPWSDWRALALDVQRILRDHARHAANVATAGAAIQ